MPTFYGLGNKWINIFAIKNAIPIPNNSRTSGILPARTLEVLEAISVTIVVGIVIFYFPLGIKPISLLII